MGKLTSSPSTSSSALVENNNNEAHHAVVVIKKKGSSERKGKNGKVQKKTEPQNSGGTIKKSSPKKNEKKIKKSIKKDGKKAGKVKFVGDDSTAQINKRKRHQLKKKAIFNDDDDVDDVEDDDEAMEVDQRNDADYQPPSDSNDSDSSKSGGDDDDEDESTEMEEDETSGEEADEVEPPLSQKWSKNDKKREAEETEIVSSTPLSKKWGNKTKSGRISSVAAAAAAARGVDKDDFRGIHGSGKKYAEPDCLTKLDRIQMSRDEQLDIFIKKEWQVSDVLDAVTFNMKEWQEKNPSPGPYFFGPDKYIYPNMTTMKKFMETLKKGENDSLVLPFAPMEKEVCKNPRIVIGISGIRHIQKAGGLAVWPVFFISKEQYNDNNRSYNTKVVRTNFPLYMVDRLTQGLAELCKGIKFDF